MKKIIIALFLFGFSLKGYSQTIVPTYPQTVVPPYIEIPEASSLEEMIVWSFKDYIAYSSSFTAIKERPGYIFNIDRSSIEGLCRAELLENENTKVEYDPKSRKWRPGNKLSRIEILHNYVSIGIYSYHSRKRLSRLKFSIDTDSARYYIWRLDASTGVWKCLGVNRYHYLLEKSLESMGLWTDNEKAKKEKDFYETELGEWLFGYSETTIEKIDDNKTEK